MGSYRGGLLAAWLIAFVMFHAGDGSLVGVDTSDGSVIVRSVPKGSGIEGSTLIETGAGTVVVREPPDEVMQKLKREDKENTTKENANKVAPPAPSPPPPPPPPAKGSPK